nr:hypothetical protein [Tanacetum cinerariifolium]
MIVIIGDYVMCSWMGHQSRGNGRTRGRSGDQCDGRIDGQGGQVGGQVRKVNDGVNGVLGFSTVIAQQLQNLLPTIVAKVGDQGKGQGNGRNQNGDAVNDNIRGDISRGCTYKEFLACNPKEYDGKGGAIVLVPHLVTSKGKRINPEKRGNGGETSKDKNDNKRTRTKNTFATTANLVRGGYTGMAPKCTTCNYHHSPETPCRTCFNCKRPGHFSKDCRVVPRNVNPINATNPVARTCYECGSTDHIKAACPRLNQAQRPRGNPQNQVMVKEKQEKDKIGTKPNKKGKRGEARQCRRPITVKKAEERRKYKFKGPKVQILQVVLIKEKEKG